MKTKRKIHKISGRQAMASFLPEATIWRTIHGRKGKLPDNFMKSGHNVFFSIFTWGDVCVETICFLIPTEEKVNCYKIPGRQGTKISWTLLEVMMELKNHLSLKNYPCQIVSWGQDTKLCSTLLEVLTEQENQSIESSIEETANLYIVPWNFNEVSMQFLSSSYVVFYVVFMTFLCSFL